MAKKMDDKAVMMDKGEMRELMSHLQNHIMYPASKEDHCRKLQRHGACSCFHSRVG